MRRFVFLLMLVLTFSVCTFANNQGYADDLISVATGNWVDTTTWDTGTLPTAADNALIESGYTVSIGGTDAAAANTVLIAPTAGVAGNLFQNGGTLSTATYMRVGAEGTGTFTLEDGTVNLTTFITLGHGSAATGTVNQSGGTLDTDDDLLLGRSGIGIYNLTGGAFTGTGADSDLILGRYAGSTGTFNQYDGTLAFTSVNATTGVGTSAYWIGYLGTGIYNMSGGSCDISSYISLGYGSATASGSISQSAGTITCPDDILVGHNGIGVYTMTGGAYVGSSAGSDLIMGSGSAASGTFNQYGGTVTLGNSLWVGNYGTAVYKMTDGSLNVGTYITVGRSVSETATGTGTFDQSGGTVTAGDDLLVGHYGNGEYNLTGGSISLTGAASNLIVGTYSGSTGTFNQAAGTTVSVNEYVSVGYYSTGTYNMTGGSLSTATSLFVGLYGSSVGTLNQSGGTVSVAGNAWVASYSSSTGTYTLSGDATANFASDLNVCAAFADDGETSPAGATGTLNIVGDEVTLTVGGNLVANGASVDSNNASIFNFTTDATTGNVSTIDVTGFADIDYAIFDILEGGFVAGGTVLDLIEADGGILNFGTVTLGTATPSDWSLQISGNILQVVKEGGIPGDTNGDGIVNDVDATTVASNWGQTGLSGGPAVGDFNGDGAVNAVDASIMAAQWGNHNESQGEGAVPEPSTLVLLAGCLLAFFVRRNR